jgi:NAD+ kinase
MMVNNQMGQIDDKDRFMNRPAYEAFKTVAVFGKNAGRQQERRWLNVAKFVESMGCRVLVEEETASNSKDSHFEAACDEKIAKEAELALVSGGDGTLLGVARRMVSQRIPLLGINHGRLGFMTDIRQDDIERTLSEILKGRYLRDDRAIFKGQIRRKGELLCEALAINDIVVSRGIVGGMVEIRVSVDGNYMYDLRADGLIVSTPTGSTAYALSAHGPIMHPSLQGIVLVPVAPHALTNRPIALPNTARIEIEVRGGPETGVHFDMQSNVRLEVGDVVSVEISDVPISLIHPISYDYFSMLRQKLHWSASPIDWTPKTRGSRDSGHAN